MTSVNPAGVLFDFDGVVVDSLAVHLMAWERAYQELYGVPLVSSAGLAGRSTHAIADILAARAGKHATSAALADAKRSHLKAAGMTIEAMPGALAAFKWLSERGIPFGIASNAPRAFIEQTLSHLGAKVDHVFGSDDVPRAKPEPDIFLLCARRAGIVFTDHARTLVFEDSTHGLQAAVSAGMYAIGVTTQHPSQTLLDGGAKKTCAHIQEAMDLGWFQRI